MKLIKWIIFKCYDELILVRGQILHQFSVLIFLVVSWIFIEAFSFSSGGIIVYSRTNKLKFSYCLQQIIAISPNNPKQQQLDLHVLIKQVWIVNKQLASQVHKLHKNFHWKIKSLKKSYDVNGLTSLNFIRIKKSS